MTEGIEFFGPLEVFDKVVAKYMSKYGFNLSIERTTEDSEYDTETGSLVAIKEVIPVRGMMFDMTLQSNGSGVFRSTLISDGDKQMFILPSLKNTEFPSVTIDKLLPERDVVVVGDIKYKIVTFKEINPSTTNSCLWELYIRK